MSSARCPHAHPKRCPSSRCTEALNGSANALTALFTEAPDVSVFAADYLVIVALAYRWYRVGGLDYLRRRTDIGLKTIIY
jgi:hypothetical protein